jgi:hypothetical protein
MLCRALRCRRQPFCYLSPHPGFFALPMRRLVTLPWLRLYASLTAPLASVVAKVRAWHAVAVGGARRARRCLSPQCAGACTLTHVKEGAAQCQDEPPANLAAGGGHAAARVGAATGHGEQCTQYKRGRGLRAKWGPKLGTGAKAPVHPCAHAEGAVSGWPLTHVAHIAAAAAYRADRALRRGGRRQRRAPWGGASAAPPPTRIAGERATLACPTQLTTAGGPPFKLTQSWHPRTRRQRCRSRSRPAADRWRSRPERLRGDEARGGGGKVGQGRGWAPVHQGQTGGDHSSRPAAVEQVLVSPCSTPVEGPATSWR